jgi:hypothetical protein
MSCALVRGDRARQLAANDFIRKVIENAGKSLSTTDTSK